MRKLALLVVGTLLVTSKIVAGNTSLDKNLAKSMVDSQKNKRSDTIVYGGQDISRGNMDLLSTTNNQPILIG